MFFGKDDAGENFLHKVFPCTLFKNLTSILFFQHIVYDCFDVIQSIGGKLL